MSRDLSFFGARRLSVYVDDSRCQGPHLCSVDLKVGVHVHEEEGEDALSPLLAAVELQQV